MRKSYALAAALQGDVEHNGETLPKFRGATVALADGTMLDIGAALQDSKNGVLVTEDPELQMIFDAHPALVQARGDIPDNPDLVTGYESRTRDQLLALPQAAVIDKSAGMSKDELVHRIRLHDAGENPNQPREVDVPKGRTEPPSTGAGGAAKSNPSGATKAPAKES